MQHLDSPILPAPPTAEPSPPLDEASSPRSLLSLPDELLALVVDRALSEHAPRLYKDRQETGRALSLVNKRVGGIAQPKLVEAVHVEVDSRFGVAKARHAELVAAGGPIRTRVLSVATPSQTTTVVDRLYLHTFTNLRRLLLVDVDEFDLNSVGKLPELRELVLSSVDLSASQPVAASKLESITLFFGSRFRYGKLRNKRASLLTAHGVPALEHIYFGGAPGSSNSLCEADHVARTPVIGSELLDVTGANVEWADRLSVDKAGLDKVLFDLPSSFIPLLELGESDAQHLRIYSSGNYIKPPPHGLDKEYQELAEQFPVVFPHLKSLYVAAALDHTRFMLPRDLHDAMSALAEMCHYAGVELVFEGAFDEYIAGESRRSAHFEARCRRVEAERAAQAATSSARA